MPSKLRKFNKKPKFISSSEWKGAGEYYKRSTGWSKWSKKRDLRRGSRKSVGIGRYKQTHDIGSRRKLTKSGLSKRRR